MQCGCAALPGIRRRRPETTVRTRLATASFTTTWMLAVLFPLAGRTGSSLTRYATLFLFSRTGLPLTRLSLALQPGIEFDLDGDTRLAGLNAADLLKWRWLCATGVYHAAGNTLSLELLRDISNIGSSVEEYFANDLLSGVMKRDTLTVALQGLG